MSGIHHVTAIAGRPNVNFDFYTKVLGLRFVKKTVNFDDPGTYHFYYGNEKGEPGTILTFFPWKNVHQGYPGVGMATEIGYAVPQESFNFWIQHLKSQNISFQEPVEQFGEMVLPFS